MVKRAEGGFNQCRWPDRRTIDKRRATAHRPVAFDIGGYFAARGAAIADPRFLDVVPVRFAIAEPERHYHVPLLASPWAYSTYRGN